MLSSVEVRKPATNALISAFPLRTPRSAKFKLRAIDGLGPVDATILDNEYAFSDGRGFNLAKTGPRDIAMLFAYNESYSSNVQTLRRELYATFPTKGLVRLRFLSDSMPTVYIDGYVERHAPSIFSKTPEVQVSIRCLQPFFQSILPVTESVPLGSDTNISDYLYLDVDGDVSTGIEFNIKFNAEPPAATRFILRHYPTSQGTYRETEISNTRIADIIGAGIRAGDTLTLNSNFGSKGIYLKRSGSSASFNITGSGVSSTQTIDWPQLTPHSVDRFRYEIPNSTVVLKDTVATIVYRPRYEGL